MTKRFEDRDTIVTGSTGIDRVAAEGFVTEGGRAVPPKASFRKRPS